MKNKRLDYKFQVVIIVHAVRERTIIAGLKIKTKSII